MPGPQQAKSVERSGFLSNLMLSKVVYVGGDCPQVSSVLVVLGREALALLLFFTMFSRMFA
jgi:hypothetical protein